jgi:hypothetical protein
MSDMNPARRWLVTGAIAVGALLGAAGIANAVTGSSTTDSSASTGEKVTAAALEAVPGGTIVRVETDSGGAAYEAHMTKADGTSVTVLLDSDFKVTATEEGFGAGHGRAPAATSGA